MRNWMIALVASASLLAACDKAMSPCVEIDAPTVVFRPDCPDYGAAELSSLAVYDGTQAVWSIANSSRDNLIDHINYGETPSGWTTSLEPAALEAGKQYTADFRYYDAPSQTREFTAP